jgi:DNA-binding MarR family transcriptional regulator
MKVPAVFANNTEWLLMMVGTKAAQIVEPLVKKYGVSIREMTVMKLIDGQTMNQQAIATLLSISRNAVVDVVDSLELKELARRQKNPENRREQFITLTPKGEKCLYDWSQHRSPTRFWVGTVLCETECETLTLLLIRLFEAGEQKLEG